MSTQIKGLLEMTIPIKKIRAVLKTRNGHKVTVRIEDTPHFKLLCGDKEAYVDYLSFARQPDHTLEKYESLINNFQYSQMGKLKLERVGEHYLIRDGLHRIAILRSKGFKSIT